MNLINLETADVMYDVDKYRVRELGLPDNYVIVENVTTKQWIKALQNLANK